MNWSNVQVAVIVIGVTTVLTFFLSKPIGAYQLGESYAQSMGVNIRFFRVALILLSSILSASVTAFAGPISFVGIAVPYLVKTCTSYIETFGSDTRNICWWSGILYDL